MLENKIETRFKKKVEERGGWVLKFISPGCRGVPDRLVFMPGGQIYLAEIKAPRGKLSPLQKRMREKFIELGFKYYVIDSYEGVEGFIREVCTT